ncbi:unnamed protein product [Callosobruchus maculatus]|uniref:Uncharacterized protein n=1 Tax=Callosobruchus maculatus TaxID=64391 RepID=A0A653DDW5_CALMS|nr:unnamed protein product [Callosobruchus maculatus]
MKPTEKHLVFHKTLDSFGGALFCTFFVSKSTPLGYSLQYWSQEIFEKGFIVKWRNDLTSRINGSVAHDGEKPTALTMKDYDVLALLLGIGYTAGLIVLIFEIIVSNLSLILLKCKEVKICFFDVNMYKTYP